ncbi:hypothetical protein XELAEV_18035004mg [Xenopus laevis]|uniref:Uncharacterized protein n=1 Tax=Xenopus laevis TaxID=8355 RepID=A0A974CFX9_XENLA|nr:hypothetical protein XELAEV_18035004mg [Xenopus laevis]
MEFNRLSKSIPMIKRSYGRSTINVGCLRIFLPILYVSQDVPFTCKLSPPTLIKEPSNAVNLGFFFDDPKICWNDLLDQAR